MCGIAGYVLINNTQEYICSLVLDRMQHTLAHRGPHSSGVWICPNRKIGLAHRRLALVDPSPNGTQPMSTSDASCFISYNGEIYNYQKLKHELIQLDFSFRSHTDTEVILYAYQAWGINFLHKLRGMFAFVLVDLYQQVLYLVRDRIGIKPLYFAYTNTAISFASEIKALLHTPHFSKSLNNSALSHYLTYLSIPAPFTLYNNIYKLPAGFYARITLTGTYTFAQWYNPLVPETSYPLELITHEHSAATLLTNTLDTIMQEQVPVDQPIGISLSGGLDSSLLTAKAVQYTSQVHTFHISFKNAPETNEQSWAAYIATILKTCHHTIELDEKEAFDLFQTLITAQHEPIADPIKIALFAIASHAYQQDIRILLLGEGADELFCGYSFYLDYITLAPWYYFSQKALPHTLRTLISHLYSRWYPERQRSVILEAWAHNRDFFWGGAWGFTPLLKKNILNQSLHTTTHDPIIHAIYDALPQNADSYAILDFHRNNSKEHKFTYFSNTMLYLELKHRLPELILTRTDQATMAASVEARVPFLDHMLVEYALQIPHHLKVRSTTTKYIVKELAKTLLPSNIVTREKIGFRAPTLAWLQEGRYFKPYFQELLQNTHHSWGQVLDFNYINFLIQQTKAGSNYADHLWAILQLLTLPFS